MRQVNENLSRRWEALPDVYYKELKGLIHLRNKHMSELASWGYPFPSITRWKLIDTAYGYEEKLCALYQEMGLLGL